MKQHGDYFITEQQIYCGQDKACNNRQRKNKRVCGIATGAEIIGVDKKYLTHYAVQRTDKADVSEYFE